MRYLYTDTCDEGCHEASKGVFGRPVRNDQIKKLMAAGWKADPADVQRKRGRKAKDDEARLGEPDTEDAGDQHPDEFSDT